MVIIFVKVVVVDLRHLNLNTCKIHLLKVEVLDKWLHCLVKLINLLLLLKASHILSIVIHGIWMPWRILRYVAIHVGRVHRWRIATTWHSLLVSKSLTAHLLRIDIVLLWHWAIGTSHSWSLALIWHGIWWVPITWRYLIHLGLWHSLGVYIRSPTCSRHLLWLWRYLRLW